MAAEVKPSRKKRLLFLYRATALGGSEIVVLNLLKAIDYETTTVFLASPVDVFSKILRDLEVPVTCLPLTVPFNGKFFGTFISWLRCLMPLRPDKIILAEAGFRDFPFSTSLAAFVVARGNFWMMQLHPPPERAKQNSRTRLGFISRAGLRERLWAWLTRDTLAVSHGVKDRLVRCYGYAPKQIGVVYNGIDTKHFTPVSQDARRALRGDLKIPENAVVVVSTARLAEVKRLDRLMRAFGALSFEHSDLWLLLTGDGPLRDHLKHLAEGVNKDENIRFLGYVEDVCPVLRASDIYVLPSDEEGFALALAEAMACELVCVATKTVGPSEIIEDGVNGFLTDLTYDGVLKGLDCALRLSNKERHAIGRRARQRILGNFCVEEAVAKGLAFMKIDQAMGTANTDISWLNK
jgi:glycosyltransferase involved in cell wall biosynthesis